MSINRIVRLVVFSAHFPIKLGFEEKSVETKAYTIFSLVTKM